MEKETHGKELYAATQGDWKWNSGFEKKEELEANSIYTLKIKKICFSPKVLIQPYRPKSGSALPGAIWAQFRPKKRNQKAIPATVGPISALGPNQP